MDGHHLTGPQIPPPRGAAEQGGRGSIPRLATAGDDAMTPELITEVITLAAAAAPRSRQVELGPSEAGEPCTRRLAYKLLDWDRPDRAMDRWAPVQGVAVHAWLAEAFRAENERLGRDRYLIERRVQPLTDEQARQAGLPGGLAGSCDLFDRDQGLVTDWKHVGRTRLAKYTAEGPGQQYRTQAHLYGRGMAAAGEDVRDVAVVFLPRASSLTGIHVWREPYDPAVAAAVVARLTAIRDAVIALDPEKYPGRWGLFPTAADSCRFCPWLKPGSRYLAMGCPGHLDAASPAAPFESLIA
jgi:hypothetical protein